MAIMWWKGYAAKSKTKTKTTADLIKQAAEEAANTNPTENQDVNPIEGGTNELTEDNGEVANTTNKPTEISPEMRAIYERLERLEREGDELRKENAELRKWQANVFLDWKKFYEWPRKYSYKMWWWKPALSYKSFKKDPAKDLVYKDQFWQWRSNHYLKLQLVWDEEVEVEVNEFNKYYTNSEKMFAEKCTDTRWNLLWYEFDTEEFGKFIVAENMIN